MDLIAVLKYFAAYGQTGVFFGLCVVLIFVAKFFYKEYKKLVGEHKDDMVLLKDRHETDIVEHKKDYEDIVKQMFEVVNKNTESNTKLSEAVKELSFGIHYKGKD